MIEWTASSLWWRRWLETFPSSPPFIPDENGTHPENRSGDVLCANCISNPDPVACLRAGVVALLAIFTAFTAFGRIVRLHATQPSHIRLLLYYLLCVHCIAGSFEWLLGWNTQLALFISYAKAVELVVICYYYLDVASKMMHWSSVAGRRLCFSALFLLFTFFTLFLVMGLLLSIEPWTDCHAPYWIWFAVGEMATVQLMVGSFFLILKRMRRISASSNIQRNQKIDLFSLFWSFQLSALADLGYHISLFMLADDNRGCSGVFNHDQLRYSLLKAPYDFFSFLLPVWAILYVFRTGSSKRGSPDDVSTEVFSSRGSSRASSIASIAEVVVVRNWRRRYRPLTQPSSDDRPILPGRPRPQNSRLRAVSSAPSIQSARRMSVSRSLVSSPLYSIPEEMHHLAMEHTVEDEYSEAMVVGSVDRCSIAPLMDDE